MKLIPTPKITYKQQTPDPDHVFPTDLTAKYCSEGKHPDAPSWPINKTEYIAECIDYLTGHEVGTYAASLEYGTGSSFSPDDYGVATYHMINSANKLFNYWERHHRGFHEALGELSIKMTPENLQELKPPPPPPPHHNVLKQVLMIVGAFLVGFAISTVGPYLYGLAVAWFSEVMATTSTLAIEVAAAEDVAVTAAEGSVARAAAEDFTDEAIRDTTRLRPYRELSNRAGCSNPDCAANSLLKTASRYKETENPNLDKLFKNLRKYHRIEKRDTAPEGNFGFFTTNQVNEFFLPTLMDNVHQSFIGSGQNYSDISSYLSAASENLLYHFDDTLHNNFFTGNKSVLAGFTVNQISNDFDLLDNDDDIYHTIKQSTYDTMAATILSDTLRNFNIEICDTKPSFCGQSCDTGHIYCPMVGNDTNKCVITAADSQLKELNSLRTTSDICSNDNSTGWDINHNPNCDISQFRCQ